MGTPDSNRLRMKMNQSISQTLISGVYRTGSEFLAQHLNAHPEIDVSMYRINVPRFILNRYDPISETSHYMAALRDMGARLRERYGAELDIEGICEDLTQLDRVTYAGLYDVIMSRTYLDETKKHWAEKNQLQWREIPWFVENMPNGKAITILRDPRSVLISFKRYTYADPPAYLGAIFNCYDAMLHTMQYANSISTDRFYWVKYEDFAMDPLSHTKRIWSWLGLTESSGNEDREWVDAYGKPWHSNSSFQENDPTTTFDINASINRWKQGLSEEEIALTEVICGEMMDAFGYERSIVNPDWPTLLKLFIEDEKITDHFRNWLLKGEGIEAFPTDPLKSENWEKVTS